jgi:predicted metalloprotease with PDZ domain
VQRQIDDGDFSAYGLLYTEGSNFWLAVDQAILAASEGKRSLDDELPFLLTAEYLQGRLPPAIVERLRAAAGASAFDGLLVGRVGQSP